MLRPEGEAEQGSGEGSPVSGQDVAAEHAVERQELVAAAPQQHLSKPVQGQFGEMSFDLSSIESAHND